jgi:transcriptional regulator GlxA family with amidase domain
MSVRILFALPLLMLLSPLQAAAQEKKERLNVAIVVHEGVELLDFAGPGEVFAAAGGGRVFNVFTVAPNAKPLTSQRFLSITPRYTITDCPKPDILVIPGGNTGVLLRDPAFMEWVKKAVPETQVTLTVCTGAFVLAELGMLDGLEATTHYGSISGLKNKYTKVKVKENCRFVDNGKIVTSAGVSAGIDSSLHVVARFCGFNVAQGTARYMEYKWEPEEATKKLTAPTK